jgi:hypothetical protein
MDLGVHVLLAHESERSHNAHSLLVSEAAVIHACQCLLTQCSRDERRLCGVGL